MSSDGRYIYQQPQESVPPSYGYPQYAPSGYDTAQYPSNPPRPVRNNSSQSHSPPQPHQPPPPPPQPAYSPASSAYPQHPPYNAPPYGVAPPPQQWTGEGWSNYSPSFTGQNLPVQQAQSFNSSNGRPEAPQNPPGEHRASSSSSKPDFRRDERPPRPEATPQSQTRNARDPEPSATPQQPPPSLGLDFIKLLESYRFIIDSTRSITAETAQGRSAATAETMEKMLQVAAYGAQALDAASKRAASDLPPEPTDRSGDEGEGGSSKAVQKSEQPPPEGQTCLGCSATSTPEWRRGPMGPRTLCNACGLVYAKLVKKRTRDPGRPRGSQSMKQNAQTSRNDTGQSDDSEDEDSYDSQGRLSEGGRD